MVVFKVYFEWEGNLMGICFELVVDVFVEIFCEVFDVFSVWDKYLVGLDIFDLFRYWSDMK